MRFWYSHLHSLTRQAGLQHGAERRRVFLSAVKETLLNRKNVSTLTPLAAAFNTKPQRKLNFSLRRNNAGLFLIPELADYSGFYLLQHQVKAQVELLVEEATSRNRSRKMVTIFDELSDCLCCVADMADFVRISHPDRKFSEAAEDTCVKLSNLVEKLNTNTAIHSALQKVLEEGDVVEMDGVDRRVAELFMFDFEQSGIHLDQKKRQKFVKLNESILMLGSYFQQGTQRGTSVPKEHLPEKLRHVFGIDGDNITVMGLFSDHYSDLVREAAYKIFLHPDSRQEELLSALLSARCQLANLVGFDTYSHRANRGTMMESPESVMEFLNLLSEKLKPRVEEEMDQMLQIKREQAYTSKMVHAWDPPHYSAVGRQRRCSVDTNEIMQYLSLGSIMAGLDGLFTALYGVGLHNVPMEPGESWHYEVLKLVVQHESEGILGYIYCDFFERPGKPNQDCHFTIRGGRQCEDGSYQLPVVVLQLNLPAPAGNTPTLLTPGMMENLFHEFGHAMHSMLGRTKYQHVTGTRCTTDFAEIPSVLMEFFASDPRVISSFARHYKSGEPLSESVVQDMCAAKHMFAASDLQQQTFYSALDQVYHGPPLEPGSTTSVMADVQGRYSSIPYVPQTAWQLRFGHLVGYGARYYSYLISRAVAARLWHSCFRKDPFDRNMGQRYREEMLQHGGGIHPSLLVEGMLGEKPDVENLVDSLISDLDSSKEIKQYGTNSESTPRAAPRVKKEGEENADLDKGKRMATIVHSYTLPRSARPAPRVKAEASQSADLDKGRRMAKLMHESHALPQTPRPASRAVGDQAKKNLWHGVIGTVGKCLKHTGRKTCIFLPGQQTKRYSSPCLV